MPLDSETGRQKKRGIKKMYIGAGDMQESPVSSVSKQGMSGADMYTGSEVIAKVRKTHAVMHRSDSDES